MIVALLLALMSAQSFESWSPDAAARQIQDCGLGPVTMTYVEEWQSYVFEAHPSTATDEQLLCAKRAAKYGELELPPALESRYHALQDPVILAAERAQARSWLAERNLLDRVPAYLPGTSDDAVTARSFEALCGIHASGAFDRRDVHAFSPEWLARKLDPTDPAQLEAFTCLLSVAQFTGFKIGFVGNEAPAVEAPPVK